MATSGKPVELTLVACEVCLKEVPITEATIPEASDYFVHFCGFECFEKWKSQHGKSTEPGGPGKPTRPGDDPAA